MKISKRIFAVACTALISLAFTACKKDDKSSTTTSTLTTSTTSTTSTTGTTSNPGVNTLVFEGTAVPGIAGNCEYSAMLTVTGEVTLTDGTKYFASIDFSTEYPDSGTYTTVELPSDPIGATQCHLLINRTKGSYLLGMLAPTGALVKVAKTGIKYTISFDTIDFLVKKGGNGTRKISCTGFGC